MCRMEQGFQQAQAQIQVQAQALRQIRVVGREGDGERSDQAFGMVISLVRSSRRGD